MNADFIANLVIDLISQNKAILFLIGSAVILLNVNGLIINKIRGIVTGFDDDDLSLEISLEQLDSEIESLQETLNPEIKRERLQDELDDLMARREEIWEEITLRLDREFKA